MSRKPGERIWEGNEHQYDVHTELPTDHSSKKRQASLRVEALTSTPPTFTVSDTRGNQWYVIIATDGVPEITERSSDTNYNLESRVIKAVKRKLQDM